MPNADIDLENECAELHGSESNMQGEVVGDAKILHLAGFRQVLHFFNFFLHF